MRIAGYNPNNYTNRGTKPSLKMAPVSINFGYDFFLKKIPDIHCAYCGKKMYTPKEITYFSRTILDKSGDEFLKTLNEYTKELDGVEKEVANILAKSAFEHPEKNAIQLIQTLRQDCLPSLTKKQKPIYKEIKEKAFKTLKPELINKVNSIIIPAELGKNYSRKAIIGGLGAVRYGDAKKNLSNNECLALYNLIQIAEKLPSSTNDKDAFIVKYSVNSFEEFFKNLITPLEITTEHTEPSSENKGNNNVSGNYLGVCRKCNSNRGNTEFKEFKIQRPEIIENIKKYYIDTTQKITRYLISSGLIKTEKNYQINKTLLSKEAEDLTQKVTILNTQINNLKTEFTNTLKQRDKTLTKLLNVENEHKHFEKINNYATELAQTLKTESDGDIVLTPPPKINIKYKSLNENKQIKTMN